MAYHNHFTAAELSSYRNAFRIADSDGSGSLDHRELHALMKTSGEVVSFARVDEMMNEIDTNGDGTCDFDEV